METITARKAGIPVCTGLLAGVVTIYGTNTCPWTIKQKEAFDARKIPYQFVDCAAGKCPASVNAFPTVTWTGFQAL